MQRQRLEYGPLVALKADPGHFAGRAMQASVGFVLSPGEGLLV
jgi:hypothetical protein